MGGSSGSGEKGLTEDRSLEQEYPNIEKND